MENQILSRIQLKYDTLANWNNSTFILKKGEAAIVEVPQTATGSGLMPPAIGIKIGDGERKFSALPWIQAAAGDVYEWAKAATKPTYNANEIVNLDNYIAGAINDSNTQYRIVRGTTINDSEKYYLQSQDLGNDVWTNVSTIDFTNIYGTKITDLYNWAGDMTLPLASRTAQQISSIINGTLNVTDTAVEHQFVTAVSENGGKISVSRAALSAADITGGTLSVIRGGTGVSTIPAGEVLIGNGTSAITTKQIKNYMDEEPEDNLITDSAVKAYVDGIKNQLQQTFTGAMHFKGIAVNPITIGGTENPFSVAYTPASGDVVLAGKKEFIWDGTGWQLLGDEGSYAVKGAITNVDIATGAAISQTKIAGTTGATIADDLATKVDKVQGKGLSTNDYTNADMNKLGAIEPFAQANTIETIYVNGIEQEVDENKAINISIDLSAAGTVKGARIPTGVIGEYEDIDIDATTKKLEMARIAKSGDVADLKQDSGTVLVFNCGSALTLIE